MRTTMQTQPDELRRLVGRRRAGAGRGRADRRPPHLAGGDRDELARRPPRRVAAGPRPGSTRARCTPPTRRSTTGGPTPPDAAMVSATPARRATPRALAAARSAGAAVVHVTAIGNGGDLETVTPETSYAYTASHTGALMRLAQLAVAEGAKLGDLAAVPDAVRARARGSRARRRPAATAARAHGRRPQRVDRGGGRAEGARGGLRGDRGPLVEQFLHGPSVALDEQDTLVVLDGGGPGAEHTEAIAGAMEVTGARVVRLLRARPRRAAVGLRADGVGPAHSRSSSPRRAGSAPTASATRRIPRASRRSSRWASDPTPAEYGKAAVRRPVSTDAQRRAARRASVP